MNQTAILNYGMGWVGMGWDGIGWGDVRFLGPCSRYLERRSVGVFEGGVR